MCLGQCFSMSPVFPFCHPWGILNKWLETFWSCSLLSWFQLILVHCFFFFALEIRRGNQAIWFCFLFFLFLLHSSVKRTAQPHEWMIFFRSEHRRKQGEMSPNGCCLCYCYINPNLGLFLRSHHFLMSLDSLCLDTFQSRNFEKGYSCSYWIARAKKRPYLFSQCFGFGSILATFNSLQGVLV